jgi:hypothetical protein
MNTSSKTLRSLIDALAFANVNSLGEFRTMLHQIDRPAQPAPQATPHAPAAATCSAASFVPAVGHVQGAL